MQSSLSPDVSCSHCTACFCTDSVASQTQAQRVLGINSRMYDHSTTLYLSLPLKHFHHFFHLFQSIFHPSNALHHQLVPSHLLYLHLLCTATTVFDLYPT